MIPTTHEIEKEIRNADAMLLNDSTSKASAHYLKSIALSSLALVKLTERLITLLQKQTKRK